MLAAAVALLPVLVFLAVLVRLDSFKLIPFRLVLLTVLVGGFVAILAMLVNVRLLDRLDIDVRLFSRYVAPVLEELLKSLYIIYLLRSKRVGFLVDAAIHGFAIRTGFALVENVDYLRHLDYASLWLWSVRGFGTAVLHGSTTAAFAILAKDFGDRHPEARLGRFVPAWLLVMVVHSLFNHFSDSPLKATVLLLTVVPLVVITVFERSERTTRQWLGEGFDSDVELLDLIVSGEFRTTRIGEYLDSLKARFEGIVLADMLCLLRIHAELAIRAKGALLAREAGLEVTIGEDVEDRFRELRFLEKAIGPTGLLAIRPCQKRSSRDLWQVYMLSSQR